MSFDPGLSSGQVIDNKELCEIFKCSPQGGMRRSKATNTLVIVSNHVESIYDDRWNDVGTFHYTGMGTEGDQSLGFMQNRTLAESATNGVELFLFEVFHKGEYTYDGRVILASDPFQETQPDASGNRRKVWMFPIQLAGSGTPAFVSATVLDLQRTKKQKKAARLSDQELEARARHAPKKPGVQNIESKQYVRDANVAEHARRTADGHCRLCGEPAPFKDKDGNPFLETHHIVWLSRGGEDTIGNTVALCPNCHRKMHIVDALSDRKRLQGITD